MAENTLIPEDRPFIISNKENISQGIFKNCIYYLYLEEKSIKIEYDKEKYFLIENIEAGSRKITTWSKKDVYYSPGSLRYATEDFHMKYNDKNFKLIKNKPYYIIMTANYVNEDYVNIVNFPGPMHKSFVSETPQPAHPDFKFKIGDIVHKKRMLDDFYLYKVLSCFIEDDVKYCFIERPGMKSFIEENNLISVYDNLAPNEVTKTSPEFNPWHPITDVKDIKHLGKLQEEIGELQAELGHLQTIIARCLIQGINEADPKTNKINRVALEEEIGDVENMINCVKHHFCLNKKTINSRIENKRKFIFPWLNKK